MAKELGKPTPDSDVVNQEPRVLLIGYGWVGQYMGKYFTNAHYVESDGVIKSVKDNEEVEPVDYHLAVISVPTPMNPRTGQCDTSIVEEAVKKYKDVVQVFLIKSTVEIGTSRFLEEKYEVSVCMSPEYVGETLGHPLLEARRDAFQIIGGNEMAREIVATMFMTVLNANAPIHLVSHEEAEVIKYLENLWIMQRVEFWNDAYDVCEATGASFQAVREGLVLDPRMSRTHSNVYPFNRGWSGKCLPKDMNALVYAMRKLDKPLITVEHQITKNALVTRKDYKNSVKLIPDEPLWKK
jgi:UDPglucose 6-dehydrogenase